MAATPKIYRRLTRNVAGLASYSSLWLASDHLLLVTSTGYSENYSRIMLGDIKALFITHTQRRFWWAFAWGVIAVVAGLRMLLVLLSGAMPTGSAICLGIAAIMLLVNGLLGTGCRVHCVTGVRTVRLPALVRIKKTRRVLAQLQPLIAAAQADLAHAASAQPEAEPGSVSPLPAT